MNKILNPWYMWFTPNASIDPIWVGGWFHVRPIGNYKLGFHPTEGGSPISFSSLWAMWAKDWDVLYFFQNKKTTWCEDCNMFWTCPIIFALDHYYTFYFILYLLLCKLALDHYYTFIYFLPMSKYMQTLDLVGARSFPFEVSLSA
jgi:hypothetical protein